MFAPLFVLFILASVSQGESYSKSTVKTEIEGEGSVYTRIESEVNGQRKVFESREPGEYTLEQRVSGTSTQTKTSQENSLASNVIQVFQAMVKFFKDLFSNLSLLL